MYALPTSLASDWRTLFVSRYVPRGIGISIVIAIVVVVVVIDVATREPIAAVNIPREQTVGAQMRTAHYRDFSALLLVPRA